MVVIKSTMRPIRNRMSALRSILKERFPELFMARKEERQLLIKMMIASAAPSSIMDDWESLEILTDVSTIKQKPNKLAEVFKICGDLFCFSSIIYSASSSLIFFVR